MRRAGLVGIVWLAVACGSNVGESNLEACEDFRAAMLSITCGDIDFATLFPEDYCQPYEDALCDMAPFFACLEGSAECDASGENLSLDSTACESEANCDNL